MSALTPKADMFSVEIDVRFVPIADIRNSLNKGRDRLTTAYLCFRPMITA
jgi:hypothetical protein